MQRRRRADEQNCYELLGELCKNRVKTEVMIKIKHTGLSIMHSLRFQNVLFRSPNAQGLVHWPKYGAGEEYLQLEAKEQVVRHNLKREQYTAFTETIPKKTEQHSEFLAPLFTFRWFTT